MVLRQVLPLTTALLLVVGAAPSAQSPTLKSAMREKVANASGMLEPLIMRDFRLVGEYADRLSQISYTEISSWQSRPEPDYIKQAVAFLEAVKGLRTAATAADGEQAVAAYGALVASCARCHRQVRSGRSVSLTVPGPRVVDPPSAAP